MSKNKKPRPVSGIIFTIFIGILIALMFIGFIISCNTKADEEENEKVNYGTYRMSELR